MSDEQPPAAFAPPAGGSGWSAAPPYGGVAYRAPVPGVPAELRVGPMARFGAWALDFVLVIVTLGIGWLVWTMFTWTKLGANPGQRLLGLRIVKADTGEQATWTWLLLRNFLLGGLALSTVSGMTGGLAFLANIITPFFSRRQTLVDMIAGTVVVRRDGLMADQLR